MEHVVHIELNSQCGLVYRTSPTIIVVVVDWQFKWKLNRFEWGWFVIAGDFLVYIWIFKYLFGRTSSMQHSLKFSNEYV